MSFKFIFIYFISTFFFFFLLFYFFILSTLYINYFNINRVTALDHAKNNNSQQSVEYLLSSKQNEFIKFEDIPNKAFYLYRKKFINNKETKLSELRKELLEVEKEKLNIEPLIREKQSELDSLTGKK